MSISNSYPIMFVIKSNFAAEQGMLFKWREWLSSHVRLRACQAPLAVGFIRQKYWNGLPFSSLRGYSQPRDKTRVSCVSCIAGRFFLLRHQQVQIDIMNAFLKYLDTHYKKRFKFYFAGQEISFPSFF